MTYLALEARLPRVASTSDQPLPHLSFRWRVGEKYES